MIDRRAFICLLAAASAGPVVAQSQPAPFSRSILEDKARRLSQSPYVARPLIPEPWRKLTYDEFQHIWFDEKQAMWNDTDSALKLDLFTAGLYVERPVGIHLIENGQARTIAYDPTKFDRTGAFPDLPVDETMGYSGFRMRAELNRDGIFEEFMVFQGASYFRAIGNMQTYGLSARGLALRTGDPNGEEFPDFIDFWIERPAPDTTEFVVHALLDSPSVTGAYSFQIQHGFPTQVEVDAALFPRVDLQHVGLASLTSMFLFDETNRHRFDDFRPAVHDSEGLMIWNGNGERLWRPLANHTGVEVSAFVDNNPKGFGLVQRDRTAESYADLEAHYEARPTLWITPNGNWGEGAVELIEIPADKEIYDNIVAYWRPNAVMPAGSEQRISYQMAWGDEPDELPDLSRVTNTRIGKGFDQIKTVFAIDFETHAAFEGPLDDLEIILESHGGTVSQGVLQRNPGTGGLRLAFSLEPSETTTTELRAQLLRDEKPVTEVWLYRWTS